MNDSNRRDGSRPAPDESDADRREKAARQRREHRVEAVKRWVEYVEEQSAETWGTQQNRLVNSQLESARETELDADHYRRVERAERSW